MKKDDNISTEASGDDFAGVDPGNTSARVSNKIIESPFYLFILTIVSIFSAETIVMMILSLLPKVSIIEEALFDALLLQFIVFPVLYVFVFKPLLIHINERKRVESDREKLILELKASLDKIKTLRGMLPICASCNKIRDDQGYWNKVADYISAYSEVKFTHGFCPECAEKLYSRFYKK